MEPPLPTSELGYARKSVASIIVSINIVIGDSTGSRDAEDKNVSEHATMDYCLALTSPRPLPRDWRA